MGVVSTTVGSGVETPRETTSVCGLSYVVETLAL